jgi:hypothetical protein
VRASWAEVADISALALVGEAGDGRDLVSAADEAVTAFDAAAIDKSFDEKLDDAPLAVLDVDADDDGFDCNADDPGANAGASSAATAAPTLSDATTIECTLLSAPRASSAVRNPRLRNTGSSRGFEVKADDGKHVSESSRAAKSAEVGSNSCAGV